MMTNLQLKTALVKAGLKKEKIHFMYKGTFLESRFDCGCSFHLCCLDFRRYFQCFGVSFF